MNNFLSKTRYALPLMLASLLLNSGCTPLAGGSGEGTTTGNPIVQVKIASFTALHFDTLAVNELRMCFKRLRFKKASSSSSDEDLDLNLGLVTINPSGNNLTTVSIPSGTYDRVEFDLEEECSNTTNEPSLYVDNGRSGSPFQTDDRISIRFEGTFVVDESVEVLELGIQAIVDSLDSATSNSNLKDRAENASGTF